ncbi:MAG TPA: oligopeptide/dipeptide ABC transporter ATP-binding protein [Tianweitania sediminis]|jgi:peptide/nickel transport system ATP-binding protein|nr:oligopeptide/dipeptide ABC transporter ATP-binding protein [Tianweitania sediminis]
MSGIEQTSSDTPLLQVRGLVKTFGSGPGFLDKLFRRPGPRRVQAVRCVDFDLRQGQTLALVGESGCGKSTVAGCVSGLTSPTAGTVTFRGIDMTEIARKATAERAQVQMIFQDPYSSLNPRWKVGRSIGDPILSLGIETNRKKVNELVGELLTQVGLSPADAHKFPHEFSGGQRQRIAIARALSTRPQLIICDEPTSALDVSVQAQILNKMRDLQEELSLTFLFITHDLGVVDHMADEIGVMYLGQVMERASRDDLFARPRHPYTQALLGAIPQLNAEGAELRPPHGELPDPANPPSGCPFRTRCPHVIARCADEQPELRQLDRTLVACHRAEEVS